MKKVRLPRIKTFFTPHRIWLVVVFLLLVGWAVINFTQGHRAYGLLIIAFFVVSVLLPKPSFTLVLVSVIAYVFLSSVSLSALTQVRSTINSAMKHPKEPLVNLLTPHTGLEVLPEPVQRMLALVEEHNLETYRLSPALTVDYHIVQRIVESALPIRMREESRNVFITPDEISDFGDCELIDQMEDIYLVNCP